MVLGKHSDCQRSPKARTSLLARSWVQLGRSCRCSCAASCTASLVRIAALPLREPAVGLLEQLHGLQDRVPLGLVPLPAKLVARLETPSTGLQVGEALLLPSLTERLVQLLPASLGPVHFHQACNPSANCTNCSPPCPSCSSSETAPSSASIPCTPPDGRSTSPRPWLSRPIVPPPIDLLHLPRRLLPSRSLSSSSCHLPLRGQFRKEVRQEELILAFRHDSAVNTRSLAHYYVDNTVSDVWTDEPR
jgi:hypothetical protein